MFGKERCIMSFSYQLIDDTKHVETLIDCLYSRGIFNKYMCKQIRLEKDDYEKTRCLYEYITTRGPAAYEHLIGALYETGNDTVADSLLEERYGTKDYLKIKVKHSMRRDDLNPEVKVVPVYKMESKPRGYALIVNMFHFCNDDYRNYFYNDKSKQENKIDAKARNLRFGSYRDSCYLYSLLTQLGYIVTMRYDLTKPALIKELESFRDKDYSEVDSCFVVIMSQGVERDGKVMVKTFDNYHNDLWEYVWKMFNSIDCPSLHNKPKMFLIHVDSAKDKYTGMPPKSKASPEPGLPLPSNGNDSFRWKSTVTDGRLATDSKGTPLKTLEPSVSDIYLIYSLIPDAPPSTREEQKREQSMLAVRGSLLVRTLCEVFMNDAHNTHLSDLMSKIRAIVNSQENQTVRLESTFKRLYFNPGLYDE